MEASRALTPEGFHALMARLAEMEKEFPGLVTPDSPTLRVGGAPVREFPTVEHRIPMLSLANTYSEEEIREFDTRDIITLNISTENIVFSGIKRGAGWSQVLRGLGGTLDIGPRDHRARLHRLHRCDIDTQFFGKLARCRRNPLAG